MILCLSVFLTEVYTASYVLDLKDNMLLHNMKYFNLKLKKGDKFRILLSENPTTGYGWQYRPLTNKSLYSIVVDKYKQDPIP